MAPCRLRGRRRRWLRPRRCAGRASGQRHRSGRSARRGRRRAARCRRDWPPISSTEVASAGTHPQVRKRELVAEKKPREYRGQLREQRRRAAPRKGARRAKSDPNPQPASAPLPRCTSTRPDHQRQQYVHSEDETTQHLDLSMSRGSGRAYLKKFIGAQRGAPTKPPSTSGIESSSAALEVLTLRRTECGHDFLV